MAFEYSSIGKPVFFLCSREKMGYEQVCLSYNQLFNLFFFLFLCQINCLNAQLCTQEQNSAPLQLKRSFFLNKSASSYCDYDRITSFPKMESWKKGSDCCSWDGVDCDGEMGQVIGLDLSCSWLQGTIHPNCSLFLSFPHLQKLNLAYNDFSMSRISIEFTRFSELTHLNLSSCGFSGKVPLGVSFLNKLVSLDLSFNNGLRLEEGGFELLIQNLTRIQDLDLFDLTIPSVVPNSLLNLTSLKTLRLNSWGLHGKFPSGVFQLPDLQVIEIWASDALTAYLPNFMNMTYPLQYLRLSGKGFSGELPDSIANLKSLKDLKVSDCNFHGSIPTSLSNLTQIKFLDLSSNNFTGILPSSISNLRSLIGLDLQDNNFTGPFFSWDANLTGLVYLIVSDNCLTGPLPSEVFVPPNLSFLVLAQNLINGTIPSWVFELPALTFLDLSYNKLVGRILELQSASLMVMDLSNNNLHGMVPNSTFEFQNLTHLILSANNFSGTIPESNRFSKNLIMLELRKNNFYGIIHDSFARGNSLEIINLNSNGFEGPVPKSLTHCRELKVLDLGNNKFQEKFPHWLEHLPKLHILILRSNRFHGPMLTFKTKFPFPSLRIIDMSYNYLTGPLPEEYFKKIQAMVNVDERPLGWQYMLSDMEDYFYSMNMVIKGSLLAMEKVLLYFVAIDLSNNQFEGKIPEIIGRLNSVRGLNLSYNRLTGQIPTSLGNLTKLDSLDLSSNKLIGEIPQHLANLIWLEVLNLSHNQLTGSIPRGKQFDAFSNDSYIDNFALCGPPLSNPCSHSGSPEPPPSMVQQEEDSSSSGFEWEVILPGYGFVLVFGISMSYVMFSFGKPQWLVKMIEGVGNRTGERVRRHVRRQGGKTN